MDVIVKSLNSTIGSLFTSVKRRAKRRSNRPKRKRTAFYSKVPRRYGR